MRAVLLASVAHGALLLPALHAPRLRRRFDPAHGMIVEPYHYMPTA